MNSRIFYVSTKNSHTTHGPKSACQPYVSKVYAWMTFGVLLSGLVAYYLTSHVYLRQAIMTNRGLFFGVIIAQLACVFAFSFIQRRARAGTLTLLYLLYSALTGLTFAVIAFVYTRQSIALAFIATAGSFSALSVFGFVRKKDLSGLGSFCYMGLFGLIIMYVLGWIFPSLMGNTTQKVLAAIGVIVFAGLTAYDTQKIKQDFDPRASDEAQKKMVISGALSLYLDFINLFLSLLRLFGGRR